MTKYIRVTMSDGSQWDIPASIVARDRAAYYAESDTGSASGPEFDKVYQDEFTYTMGSDSELIDHANNNIDWIEVEQHAIRVEQSRPVNMAEEWTNAEKQVVEK